MSLLLKQHKCLLKNEQIECTKQLKHHVRMTSNVHNVQCFVFRYKKEKERIAKVVARCFTILFKYKAMCK